MTYRRYLAILSAVAVLLGMALWVFTRPTPPRPGTLGDLTTDAAALVRTLPDVALVEVRHQPAGPPAGRIVHVLDWHLTPDIADAAHLAAVELVQAEQMALLKALALQHDLERVWIEGLTLENRASFLASLEPFRGKDRFPAPPELLNAGSAARLHLAGIVKELLPAESARLHRAGQPQGGVVDADLSRLRDRAIVGNVVARDGPLAVIVLGGAHDLTNHVKADAPGWEYIRVGTAGYRLASGAK